MAFHLVFNPSLYENVCHFWGFICKRTV